MTARWDRAALRDGALVCVVFAVPPSILARLLVDDSETVSGWAPLLLLVSLGAFVVGGGVAGWRQRCGTPLSHGIVTAAAVFAAVQAVFLVVRAATGNDIQMGRVLVSFSLACAAGLVGGLLGGFLQQQGISSSRGTS